jgi:hypothetical protein
MVVAAQAHRDSIQKMAAISPLIMDENRLQLQIRCAAAEKKAEDLRQELQALRGRDDVGKIASLEQDLENLRKKLAKAQRKHKELFDQNEDSHPEGQPDTSQ